MLIKNGFTVPITKLFDVPLVVGNLVALAIKTTHTDEFSIVGYAIDAIRMIADCLGTNSGWQGFSC